MNQDQITLSPPDSDVPTNVGADAPTTEDPVAPNGTRRRRSLRSSNKPKNSPRKPTIRVPRAKNIGHIVVLSYMLVTFILTHINLSGTMLDHSNFPTQFQIVDKIYHFVAYCTLTFLVLFFLLEPNTDRKSKVKRAVSARTLAMWCTLILLYGVFDELTQPYFGRRLEALDLLANVVGISVGQALFVITEATGLRDVMWKMK